ncbi:MAG: nickel pincer cofactor biosynthesis protein LarC [Candidatus Aminicenantes bacterium]|nr:nickel pincer cofactor biosynthesis protein LarC [Candidatus Aminicenantes bacterium]
MKYIYFDCSSGASGDMILASLLSLGVSADEFKKFFKTLKLKSDIEICSGKNRGFTGLRVTVKVPPSSVERTYSEIENIISSRPLSPIVKEKSLAVFRRLFQAESLVHGTSFNRTHLHEAGADDALVDIIGSCWLLQKLEVQSIYYSPVNLGSGYVQTEHGLLPVPAPAVAELMRGIPVYSTEEPTELLTPTGAALLTTLGQCLPTRPQLVFEKIGYGLGHKELKYHPNILRAFYGEVEELNPLQEITIIEATIDDCSPQLLGNFLNQALEKGALEAYLTPVIMKKNRPGTKLTVMVEPDKIDGVVEDIFRETTTIGVRIFPVKRKVLRRDFQVVQVGGQKIRVKLSYLGKEIINYQPEFEDCLKAAKKLGLPLKKVINLTLKEMT